MELRKITVSLDGSGDFSTIKEAYDSIHNNEPTIIYVKKGEYFEKLIFEKPGITLIGQDKYETIIRYNDCAKRLDADYRPITTFKSATLQVTPKAEGFRMENLTIENCAGCGKIVGQAVALFLDADKAVIKNCRLLGNQDTLLTAPYFVEISENPYLKRRQYFDKCYIEGDVDFIFGGAVAVFNECELFSKKRERNYLGYITAACTSEKLKYGYVFKRCRLTGNADENTVFLGRPWRAYAKTVFIECDFGNHINREHFSVWNRNEDNAENIKCYYAQYGNKGENYTEETAVKWSHILTAEQAEAYTLENIFDGWLPYEE